MVKLAVNRNRMKRVMKEVFRNNQNNIPFGDYVLRPTYNWLTLAKPNQTIKVRQDMQNFILKCKEKG